MKSNKAKKIIDLDIKGSDSKTSLHFSCENIYIQIFEYLMSIGANIEAKDKYGNSLIHFASSGGLLAIVQYLIKKQNGSFDMTQLHFTYKNGHLPIVENLISICANQTLWSN